MTWTTALSRHKGSTNGGLCGGCHPRGARSPRGIVSLSVVDASVLTAFYVADDARRDTVVARLAAGDALFAPAHIDAEVVSALRGLAKRSVVTYDGKVANASGPRCEIELVPGEVPLVP